MTFIKRHGWIWFGLFFLVFAAFVNSLPNAFISDDVTGIANNPQIKDIEYLLSNPLFFARSIPFYIIYKLFGPSPAVFRLLNIFFHFGCVLLVYSLSFILTRKKYLAICVSALFAVHPLVTESVTWVSGGIYSEYTFFLLLSFLFYIFSQHHRQKIVLYVASIASFVFSISTSEKAIILPLVLFAYECSLGNIRTNWKKIIPYFVIALIWGGVFLGLRLNERMSTLNTAFGSQSAFRLRNPFIQIPLVVTSYLRLIVWPDVLTFFHTQAGYSYVRYFFSLFVFALTIFSLVLFWKKSRILFFWLSFFFLTLSPTMTPFHVSSFVAERYVYAGMIGIIFIMAYLLFTVLAEKQRRIFAYGIVGIVVVLLTIRTYVRNTDWKDIDHLWISTARDAPANPVVHLNLADVYARRREYKSAEVELKIAIKLNPYYVDAYHALGILYRLVKRDDLALPLFQKAVELNPTLWQGHRNLALLYVQQEDYKKALEHVQKALQLRPDNYRLYRDLGIIYSHTNEKRKAIEALRKALQLNSNDQTAQKLLNELDK